MKGFERSIMNIIDVLILLFILLFGVFGLKRGAIKEIVVVVGSIIVLVIAFYLKNPVANLLDTYLPFFQFAGPFRGLTSLNIVLYQLLAFFLIAALLTIVLNLFITLSNIIEKVLKATIILGIPSKIIGFILGLVEGYVVVFIALFFLHQPAFNIAIVQESKFTPVILSSSPILSNVVGDFNRAFDDIYDLSVNYADDEDKNEFNRETIRILLEYDLVEADHVADLVSSGKLQIEGVDAIINQYR